MSDEFDEAFWDERCRSHGALWSGRPNPRLVSETGDLTPATALDVGCGEGADAIWLASRAWQVTAVDFAAIAPPHTPKPSAATPPGGFAGRGPT
jgi:2-polyprenyl-3-methyl-5-hydroxy-6-metoxy-1,4-benzoquinol methylase